MAHFLTFTKSLSVFICAIVVVFYFFTVVVAQLVEGLLLTPKVCGSNPVIGKYLNGTNVYIVSTVLKR